MNIVKGELLAKIASMVAYSVPNAQIAMVCGVEGEVIDKVLETEEFQNELAAIEYANIDKLKTLNEGWDSVENVALAQVVTAMQTVSDPDYALKVAAVANKANRRGSRHNRPIEGNLGSRAVVTLNATFVERLQQNIQVVHNADKGEDPQKKKDHNFLSPKKVQNLLKLDREKEVDGIMDDLSAIPAFAV